MSDVLTAESTTEPSPERADLSAEPPLVRWRRRYALLGAWEQAAVALEVVIVLGVTLFVFAQLGPGLLLADTTPAGGDMGAHVWGPAYLRDHLLGEGRLSGWAPDWYAGFPAYQFYMVVPALLVVLLDAGVSGWAALVPLAVGLGLLGVALTHRDRRTRRLAVVAGAAVILLGCGMPYGVAFKLVTVSGLLALPAACYLAARLADLPFPGPPIVALGSAVFLFNREPVENSTGHIIGGNMASTLAGEFSFSISLAFLVLYLGFLLRGLRRGGYRATCAVLLALCALCHIIPAIYAVVATVAALVTSWPLTRERLKWFLPIGPVAVMIAAFWIGPFYLRSGYLNDMGWEKIPGGILDRSAGDLLFRMWLPGSEFAQLREDVLGNLFPSKLLFITALAAVGIVVSFLLRIRLGVLLTICGAAMFVAFLLAPQGRLWNARLLPFWFLCMCLLAAIAVAELGRAVTALLSTKPEWRFTPASLATPAAATFCALVYVGLPLGVLPGGSVSENGEREWLWFSAERNVVPAWAEWNYEGYERKDAFPEYHSLVEMMEGVAADPELGCGRAMWEYESARLDRYGTPMAPMLLPFWTDRCIGSMEGLYFEASATTPFHFLNQRALSAACSCAQRDLPYGSGFDIDLGVQQLQMMGVRYYLAFTDVAVAAAAQHPDLTEVATDGVWHAYLVAGSELVTPLENEPAVLRGVEPGMHWVGPASRWFQDPARWDVFLAEDGPESWQRIDVGEQEPKDGQVVDESRPGWSREDVVGEPEVRPLPSVEVSSVEVALDGTVSFDVSEPGVPVLIRTSYFPNWRASGADGPYRVSPNLMVVVPTETHVELAYGWTTVDIGSYAVTGLGIAGAVVLARRPRRRSEGDDDDLLLDGPDPIVPLPLAEDGDEDGDDDEDADDAAEVVEGHDGDALDDDAWVEPPEDGADDAGADGGWEEPDWVGADDDPDDDGDGSGRPGAAPIE